jgi:hypothetical protein
MRFNGRSKIPLWKASLNYCKIKLLAKTVLPLFFIVVVSGPIPFE